MTRILQVLTFAVFAIGTAGSPMHAEDKKPEKPVEGSVVIPRDTTPFKIQQDETVRLTGQGIAGAKIEAKVTGPAKIVSENRVSTRVKGAKPIGSGNVEFVIKPNGKGKVTVEVKSTPPNGDEAKVTKYEFEVE